METVAWGPRVGESVKTSRCRASKRNGMCTAGTATVQHGGQAGKTGRRASRRAGEPNGRPSRLSTLLQLGPTFAGDSVWAQAGAGGGAWGSKQSTHHLQDAQRGAQLGRRPASHGARRSSPPTPPSRQGSAARHSQGPGAVFSTTP